MTTYEEVLQNALAAHAHNIKSKMDWYKDEAGSAWWQVEQEELEVVNALLTELYGGKIVKLVEAEK